MEAYTLFDFFLVPAILFIVVIVSSLHLHKSVKQSLILASKTLIVAVLAVHTINLPLLLGVL